MFVCEACGKPTDTTNPTLCWPCTRRQLRLSRAETKRLQEKVDQALERIALGWGGPSGPVVGDVQAILARQDD